MSLLTYLAKQPSHWQLTLAGELDLSEAQRFESLIAQVIENHPPSLILDMTGLEYLDSSGLGLLLSLSKNYERAGGKLVLVTSPSVDSILSLTHVTDIFAIAPDVDSALQLVQTGKSPQVDMAAVDSRGGPQEG